MQFLQCPGPDQKQAIQRFYDRLSPHFRRLWGPHLHDGLYLTGDESREKAQEQLVEHLADLTEIPHASTVLDIGCGMGGCSIWLAEHKGCRPLGITLSPAQVEMATRFAKEAGVSAEFQVMDAEDLKVDEPFDVAWMLGVLAHLPDQERFLRGAHRLVRPGGRFMLADWTVAEDVSEQDYEKIVKPTMFGMLMPDIVAASKYEQWFEESGFRIVTTSDLTEETRQTWDESLKIVQAPAIIRIAIELGSDAIALVRAIRLMGTAMKRGLIRYSVIAAERI